VESPVRFELQRKQEALAQRLAARVLRQVQLVGAGVSARHWVRPGAAERNDLVGGRRVCGARDVCGCNEQKAR
jgi:hypothetical protein